MRNGYRILLLAVVLLLNACGGLTIGYRHADTLLSWRADEYFDFDPPQKQQFNARLAKLLAWHRYEELPEYAVFVTTAVNKARPGLKNDDVIWFVDGMKDRYKKVVNRGIDDAVDLLATLQPQQIDAIQKQWVKDNRKFIREHALEESANARKRERLNRMIDQIDDWTGSLSGEQEQKIAVLLEAVPNLDEMRNQDRLRRQKEFLEILKVRENKAELKAKLLPYLLNWEAGRSPEYARLADDAFEKRIAFYIALDKILTPDQREAALRRLQGFANDFKTLAQEKQS